MNLDYIHVHANPGDKPETTHVVPGTVADMTSVKVLVVRVYRYMSLLMFPVDLGDLVFQVLHCTPWLQIRLC